jgi:hypothetical protein
VGRMRRDRAAVVGRVARLVLLACTLLGLAAMHTIGHSAVGHGADRQAAGHMPVDAEQTLEAMAQTVASAAASFAESDRCAGDGCAHATLMPTGMSGMGNWELCVAVLTAFAAAIVLAALLLAAATGRFPPPLCRRPAVTAPRGPPVSPFGLTLATVSVLRT